MDDKQIRKKESQKRYREKNREKIRQSYFRDKEKNSNRAKEYYIKNKEDILANTREYYYQNRDTIIQKVTTYSSKNKENKKLYDQQYRKLDVEKQQMYNHNRKARKLGLLHSERNQSIIRVLFELKNRLSNCLGIVYDVDHIIPLSKGGWHHELNLQVIPRSLNQQKFTKLDFKHELMKNINDVPMFLKNKVKL